jgi:hypothetical protein
MFPTVRRAGVTTLCDGWLENVSWSEPTEHSASLTVKRGSKAHSNRQSTGLDLLEQLNQAASDARVDDLLDALIGAVWEVGESPAGVCKRSAGWSNATKETNTPRL